MFIYICLFACLILNIILSKRIFLVWVNPIVFINGTYLVWSFLGRLQYFGQYLPSYDSSSFVLMCIFIIDIAVMIGFAMPRMVLVGNRNNKITFISESKSKRILLIIRIVCLLVSVAIFINLIRMILSGSLLISNIRNLSYSQTYGSNAYTQIYFNTGIYYFYQYFIRGFALFDLTFALVLLLKEHARISALSILNFGLWAFIMLSRIEILKAVILCVLILLLSGIKLSKSQKKVLFRAFAVLVIAVLIIFSFRSNNSEKNFLLHSLDEFIIDFSGSNYMFSNFFELHFSGHVIPDVPYVLKMLGGFGLIMEYIIAFTTGYYFDHSAANQYLTIGHEIGSSDHYNAFYTVFFDSLNTGGVIGSILFCVIIGVIAGNLFKKYVYVRSAKNLYLAAYLTYIIMMGTYNYALTVPGALVIVFCLIYHKYDEEAIT